MLYRAERPAEALEHLRTAADGRRARFGYDDSTLIAIDYFDEALAAVDRIEEAFSYNLARVQDCEELLESEVAPCSTLLRIAGRDLWRLGRYEEALCMFRRSVSGLHRHLGEPHPETVLSLDWTGGAISRLGRFDEALEAHSTVLAWRATHTG